MNIPLGKVKSKSSLEEHSSLKNTHFITITHSTNLNGLKNFCQKKIGRDRHCQLKRSERVRAKNNHTFSLSMFTSSICLTFIMFTFPMYCSGQICVNDNNSLHTSTLLRMLEATNLSLVSQQ